MSVTNTLPAMSKETPVCWLTQSLVKRGSHERQRTPKKQGGEGEGEGKKNGVMKDEERQRSKEEKEKEKERRTES